MRPWRFDLLRQRVVDARTEELRAGGRASRDTPVFGFGALGFVPTISLLIAYQVLRRARSFALSRPGREGIHVRQARR
ncbi:MAG: hypothetical protein M3Q89_14945, partial [Verrucomicrobiota bacterium]|nr:hypothetical protein [Verrucomicrobiota bacterium]